MNTIDTLFQPYQQPGVPGLSALVIDSGEVVFHAAYGLANLEEEVACTIQTNYRLASVTKQFTAAAIMLLAEQGRLAYDDPIAPFFDAVPPSWRSISVRHLLNHTSGLLDYEDVIPVDTSVPLCDRDVLELARPYADGYFAPGSAYRYSNTGYVLLALIVERITGHSFAQFLHDSIFGPLGMNSTVAFEQGISMVARRAYGYSQQAKSFIRTDQSLTSSTLGDGGVYSNVEDMARWDRALADATLLSRDTLAEAFRPGARLPNGEGYGFGWFIGQHHGETAIYHTGETIGFRTAILRLPARQLTAIVLVNRNDATPLEIARALLPG